MSAEPETSGLAPGLYIVATPIGAARDITLRSLDVLAEVDIIAAEDTRRIRHLMSMHGISLKGRQLLRYDDQSGESQRRRLLDAMSGGARVALTADAGTPLVADPGFRLVRACRTSWAGGVSPSWTVGGSCRAGRLRPTERQVPVCRFRPRPFRCPQGVSSRDRRHSGNRHSFRIAATAWCRARGPVSRIRCGPSRQPSAGSSPRFTRRCWRARCPNWPVKSMCDRPTTHAPFEERSSSSSAPRPTTRQRRTPKSTGFFALSWKSFRQRMHRRSRPSVSMCRENAPIRVPTP